ncbi:MAG: sulfotransferase [Gammaproteobacteria bacterium]
MLAAKQRVPANQWHEVKYEDLIAEPVTEFKKIFEACSVVFENDLVTHCQSVLDKPYNTFSEVGAEKWK